MLVGLGRWTALVQAGGSRLPRALDEKRPMPHRKPPLSFSYSTSIADSSSWDGTRLCFAVPGAPGCSSGVGPSHAVPGVSGGLCPACSTRDDNVRLPCQLSPYAPCTSTVGVGPLGGGEEPETLRPSFAPSGRACVRDEVDERGTRGSVVEGRPEGPASASWLLLPSGGVAVVVTVSSLSSSVIS